MLGERYRVLKTDGNFNNNIGLPLTLLRLSAGQRLCLATGVILLLWAATLAVIV